ncbi:Hydantoinase/oxoprolinase [Thermaerobacter marianensis DSM 12885]|uniref:Hydantoinase/oxoprolinase n=1 Tax=Thermaerobacter marianensis (strain ATCC 700841 / DSM 12885 / JCM 10246 / 7p75a) TaxID=644966 RepID=E6SIE8_THEM7|nr:hydantoinase/oxoprolinase family protein [Thermaerobacter marianensis]ADU51959.1 Hydantoinase/oxoprolinase [Thermaerobacter marianensis DSM 12885]
MRYRLGIDVGGTNTDAVILDENRRVVAKAKTPVTDDVISGIVQVVSRVIREAGIDPSQITHAMLGTTQVTNAIIERRGLLPVGILRLGSPATHAIRPLAAWPEDLRRAVEGPVAIVPGGVEYDGRPISAFDAEAVRRFAEQAMEAGIRAFAVTAVFSPVRNDDERRAAEIIASVAGSEATISLSYEIGSVGLLERENATVLNAAVSDVARRVARAFADAMARLDIRAELFLSQNDGTLMSLDYAQRYPILTVACGPTNSIRGAGFLSGREDAVVIDVGGTSTDVGVLVGGFPRESAVAVEIGGVRTNFRMPDLISIGLGGGSVVRWPADRTGGNEVQIGPDSVGSKVVERALCFGGDVLTMTDVAVARGMAALGDRGRIQVPAEVIEAAYRRAVAMVEEAVDRIKTRAGDVPAILVGGGSILLPDRLEGVSVVERPDHYEVANAVGAAIAQVSGTVDRIYSLDNRSRESVLAEAREAAYAEAVQAGADPDTVEVIEVEEVPLAYLPGNAVRVKVKAAGQLRSA